MVFKPPFPLSSASQKEESFAYESTVKRWPQILTSCIDELARLNGDLLAKEDELKLKESKQIIQDIAGFIYEIRHDRTLTPIPDVGLPKDVAIYNSILETDPDQTKWFTASWLFAECYLYRRLRALFAASTYWKTFDPFLSQKMNTFKSSAKGVVALALSMQALVERGKPKEEELHAEWTKFIEVCLWGNATDLSLLTQLTHEDIQKLQSTERGSEFILKNDLKQVWDRVSQLKGERIDFVLDNSGFELFTDLVLADWLLTLSPFCSEIVLHPKLIPWFVSDVTPHDFTLTLSSLLDPDFFPPDAGITDEEKLALKGMVERWARYVEEGKIRLSVDKSLVMGETGGEEAEFWTSPYAFSELPSLAPTLLAELQKSSLVIFKGDLNYRKLTSDAHWPTTTPFETTLGPLAGEIEILSLRTCKADVCVGLGEGVEEWVEKREKNWRVSGKYAVVSYSPRTK